MARAYSDATVTIGGATLRAPRRTFSDAPTAGYRVRIDFLAVDPHADAMVRARSVAVDALATDTAIARRLRAAILGGDLSVSGRLWLYGSRGCFHDGCDETTEPEEGGSHWCRFAEGGR